MSAVVSKFKPAHVELGPKPVEESVVVGKDILELLAGSMYVDPLSIYREYIQNAADAIDEAIETGREFDGPLSVSIYLDPLARTIRIRDNGIGIRSDDFVKRLVTIGASQKRGKNRRGFRGIGRLAGLGFCQDLIFRGRVDGETRITELTWNGRTFRDKIRDESFVGGLAELVQQVAVWTQFPGDGFPNRFFEAELKGVLRMKNDLILNEDAVRSYLAQVAPVPFHSECHLGTNIQHRLDEAGIRPPLRIEMNDSPEPITHRLRDHITISATKSDQIRGVEFFEWKAPNGDLAAIGWIADHSYLGALPRRLGLGGIRLRSGNIQVGDEFILEEQFTEARFATWAIGDIHVVAKNILPNARRDEFEQSVTYAHLRGELAIRSRTIAQTIRDRSGARNRLKAVQQDLYFVDEWLRVIGERDLPKLMLIVIRGLLSERIVRVKKTFLGCANDGVNVSSFAKKITVLENVIANLVPQGVKGRPKGGISAAFAKPVSSALLAIFASAKTPDDGVQLAVEVFKAFKTHS